MSPEQARGDQRKIDTRSDVFALGAVLFEILTGHPPYQGRSAVDVLLKAEDAAASLPEHLPIPRELRRIVATAMAPAPIDRYADRRGAPGRPPGLHARRRKLPAPTLRARAVDHPRARGRRRRLHPGLGSLRGVQGRRRQAGVGAHARARRRVRRDGDPGLDPADRQRPGLDRGRRRGRHRRRARARSRRDEAVDGRVHPRPGPALLRDRGSTPQRNLGARPIPARTGRTQRQLHAIRPPRARSPTRPKSPTRP